LLADSAYGSDSNCEAAADMGVMLVSPVGGTDPESDKRLADCDFDEQGIVTACPAGQKPWHVSQKINKDGDDNGNTTVTAHFDKKICDQCLYCGNCPVELSGESAKLKYTPKDLRLSRRRANEHTEGFRKKYSMRSGIEASNSELDRLTGAKHLRYRGIKRVSFAVTLKVLGVNIWRAMSKMRVN
jgi:hypothetical protein